jgi:predicted nucleic acid-binding protein
MRWIENLPGWLRVEAAGPNADPALNELGVGEREAIILAQEHSPEVLLLVDEIKGRAEATASALPQPEHSAFWTPELKPGC